MNRGRVEYAWERCLLALASRWRKIIGITAGYLMATAFMAACLEGWGWVGASRILSYPHSLLCHGGGKGVPFIAGGASPLCYRCLCIVGAFLAMVIVYRMWSPRRMGFPTFLMCCLPAIADGLLIRLELITGSTHVRVLTGLAAGIAAALFFLPRIDWGSKEISKYLGEVHRGTAANIGDRREASISRRPNPSLLSTLECSPEGGE